MYIVIYGIISGEDECIQINGPFFGGYSKNKEKAEQVAMEITNTDNSTDSVIIPWVLKLNKSIPETISIASNTWLTRLKQRVIETSCTIAKDITNNGCPFDDYHLYQVTKLYI